MAAGRENFIFFLCPLDGVRFIYLLILLIFFCITFISYLCDKFSLIYG